MSLVSVLMPMRNAEPFIRATLESILGQRDVALEVIVIDDGSTDRSAAMVQGFGDPRIRLLPGPCRGIGAAFNAALAAAGGDVVTRCDADDLYPADRLAWQVRWLAQRKEFGAICGQFETLSSTGKPVLELGGAVIGDITDELLHGQTRTHLGTYAIRTEFLRQIGGCRPFFETAEDLDLQFRLSEVCRVWFEPRVFYRYRLHDQSITHTQSNVRKNFFEDTARMFAGQRRAGQADDLERGCPPPVPMNATGPADSSGQEIQGILLSQAWTEHAAGRRFQALRTGWRACSVWPRNLSAWKSLAMLVWKRTPGD